jgi:phage-related minor tail protein
MGHAVSKSNKDYINNNWDDLKCSPIGPFLQMIGVAPGNSSDTSSTCKSAEFSSQFNSSMTEHVNMTGKLTSGLNVISATMDKFRTVIASMEQRAFKDLSQVATQIFTIYVKIGNIFYVLIKNLINIMGIFKQTVNVGAAISKLLIAFMNLLRVPVNGVINFVQFFTRGI